MDKEQIISASEKFFGSEKRSNPTLERIRKDAEEAVKNDDGFVYTKMEGFIEGAISERNKTIDEVKALFDLVFKVPPKVENLVEIIEQFHKSFNSIETLKL